MIYLKNTVFLLLVIFCGNVLSYGNPALDEVRNVLKKDVLIKANQYLSSVPITVTAYYSERSAGGLHDFFSEGDYWWPNPADPNGPYIQKDGLTNPDNFTAHRKAMIRFSEIVGTLTSAFVITGDEKYVRHAMSHCKAWFIDTATSMNPSLLYAQAIKGRVTGRGVGIIDMIQMMEVAQSVYLFQHAKAVNKADIKKVKEWFEKYLEWVTTHTYGIEERDSKNNHATCWVMQVAVFARLVNNQTLLNDCKVRFKTILLPNQMDSAGRFPLELKRTKPYGYSLFNLDAMATICHVLSGKKESLWDFTLANNSSLKLAIEFLFPYIGHKAAWPYAKDVMYWNDWPVAQPFLIFGWVKYQRKDWLDTWKKLDHFPQTEEVIRNLPIRNPLIWIEV